MLKCKMKSLTSGVLLIILISSLSGYVDSVAEVVLNRAFPRFEEESFTKSFYLGSRIPLIWLNSSQSNLTDIIFHSPRLDQSSAVQNVQNGESLSSENLCFSHLEYIIETIWSNRGDAFVLAFLDSFAKPVPGVKDGNLDWPGNQKQCESIIVSSGSGSKPTFGGKYCRAEWRTTFNINRSLSHYTGICVPNTCDEIDFHYVKSFLEKFFFLKVSENSRVEEISCAGEVPQGVDTIVFKSICFGLILLGIMSTIHGKYFEKTAKKSQERSKPSIFSIFSIPQNWQSLDGRKVSKNEILIIHHIRGSIALLIALFHSASILSLKLIPDPGKQMVTVGESFLFLVLPRMLMSIFFYLTGFLIYPDSNPFKSIFKAFIRLSPSYYLTMFAHTSYISTFGLGSKIDFGGILNDRNHCSKVFWKSLLYIQNFSPTSEGVSKIRMLILGKYPLTYNFPIIQV